MSGAAQKPIPEEIKFLHKPRGRKRTKEKARREGNKAEARRCKYCGEVHKCCSCPALGKYCKNCGIRNHFASVCQQKSQQRAGGNSRIVKVLESREDTSDSGDYIYRVPPPSP